MKRGLILLAILLLSLAYVNAESIFLSAHLEEGGTGVYETKDGSYVISVLTISDSTRKAVFRLNGEVSKGIREDDSYVFDDGSEIVVRELDITESGEGADEAYFYFYGTGEEVLSIRNVSQYVIENRLCNFDGQCLNETQDTCCYDCGCDGKECVNNQCIADEKEQVEVQQEIIEEPVVEITEEAPKEEVGEITKSRSEKKVAYSILVIIIASVGIGTWAILRRRKSIF